MKKEPRIKLIYQGSRITSDEKIAQFFQKENDGKTLVFDNKLITYISIGSIIEVTETERGFKSPYTVVGKYDNKEKITQWSAEDRAAKMEIDLKRQARKKAPGDIDNIVDDIIEACGFLSTRQRKLIALYIYERIVKGR